MKTIQTSLRFAHTGPAFVFAAVLLFILGTTSARAANPEATLSATTLKPANNLVASFTPTGTDGRGWRADTSASSDGWRDVGQSFTATHDATFDSIAFFVSSGLNTTTANACKETPFTLTIYSFASDLSASSATVLKTLSGETPAIAIAKNDYLVFDVSEANIRLKAGNVYGVLLHFDEMAASRSITLGFQIGATGTTAYAGGLALERLNNTGTGALGTLVTATANRAFEFYVQGTPVPEPATVASLLGATVLALGGACRFLRLRRVTCRSRS
ncbi:hypothetical protein [Geminisphaera colitermitum]|uniref:hypothetical protein n=1 Tax=Geminisphaera colitermitum TaxID=1148786 RepID=UPI0012FED1BE|nr:hypothetical protein [Geminisphaera colitermitum]